MSISKGTCEVGHLLVRLQHLTYLDWYLAQTLYNLEILLAIHRTLGLAHCQCDHREYRHLTREGLRRGHTDFRAHMDISTCIGSSGDARSDGIADAVDEGALLLGQLNGGQRVGRLTDGYHHIALAHHRIPVSEL